MTDLNAVQNATPLNFRDYTMIFDKSTSMNKVDTLNGLSRWKIVSELAEGVGEKVCKLDPDGVDIRLFSTPDPTNPNKHYYPNSTVDKIRQIFQEIEPWGTTGLAEVLQTELDSFFAQRDTGRMKLNGRMIIVFTDGDADNKQEVKRVLVNASLRLRQNDKLTLVIFPVGTDPSLAKFLNELDTDLVKNNGAARDFVEIMNMKDVEQQGLNQVLMNCLAKEPRQVGY